MFVSSLSPSSFVAVAALKMEDASEEDASEQVAQVPHADLPRWQQAQQLGYDCCGINGCILAVRHQGECVFPEMSDRRRCQVIEPKPAVKEASLAHPKKKKSKKPPKTGASAGSANAGTSSTSTKRTPAPKPTPTPKPAAAAKPTPTPTPTPTAAAAAGDEEEAPDPDDVPCRKCGSRGNAKRMLLCDGEGGTCTAAYHTYCLTPPLLSLPKGDWFCPSCELKRQAGSGMSMRQQMRYLADLAEAPEPPAPPVATPTAPAAATAPAMADAAATAGAGAAAAAADDDAVEDEEDLPLAGR